MTPQNQRVMRKIRTLKNSRLRKVRYELRTLLLLLFEDKKREINLRMGEIRTDDSLSYDGRGEKLKKLLKERENLILSASQHPINCSFCGSREEDLIYQLENHMWVCHIREGCQQRVELNVQDFRRRIKERERI